MTKTLKQLEAECDEFWRVAVFKMHKGMCQITGQQGNDCHHVFLRRHTSTRWNLKNGVLLSRERHGWAHAHQEEFRAWFKDRIGEDEYNALEKKSREIFKPSCEELKRIIKGLKLRI